MCSSDLRAAKSTFNIRLNGYLIPDVVNRDLTDARNKFYTKSQVIFDMEVVDTTGGVSDFEKFQNKAAAKNSTGATSFIGGGINVTNNVSPALNTAEVSYLNTNKLKTADTVTAPNTAIFTGVSVLQPPAGSTLPPTSIDNFSFYINGVNVAASFVTFLESGGNVTLTFDTAGMGYTLVPADEVIAIGKFN